MLGMQSTFLSKRRKKSLAEEKWKAVIRNANVHHTQGTAKTMKLIDEIFALIPTTVMRYENVLSPTLNAGCHKNGKSTSIKR